MTARLPVCDNASAGVLIEDRGRYLVFERVRAPAGVAPPAGHVFDKHDPAAYVDAVITAVYDQTGLTVETWEVTTAGGWRDDRCRLPAPLGPGHNWRVFRVTVSGTLTPSPRETRNLRWLTGDDLQTLAARTIARARGEISRQMFVAVPGIQPVWVQWLADLGIISVSRADLALADALTRPLEEQ